MEEEEEKGARGPSGRLLLRMLLARGVTRRRALFAIPGKSAA